MDSFCNLAIFSGSVKIEILSRRNKKLFHFGLVWIEIGSVVKMIEF